MNKNSFEHRGVVFVEAKSRLVGGALAQWVNRKS